MGLNILFIDFISDSYKQSAVYSLVLIILCILIDSFQNDDTILKLIKRLILKQSFGQLNKGFISYQMKLCFFLIIVVMLITIGTATTDITLLNCPSQYNMTHYNLTTNASESLIQLFFGGFEDTAEGQRVKNIVISGDYEALKTYMNQQMVPYIIIGSIVLIIFLLLIFYCLFDKNWPPCERFRRNPIENPYSTRQRRCMAYWLLLLAICIFCAGIISFTAIPNMKNYLTYTKCSMYYLLDISMNGDVDNGWGGFVELKNKIGNISSLLDSASTQVSTYLSNDEWLVNDMVVMKNKNIQIYNQHKDAQLITPNPVTTQTNINAGFDFPRIDSVFIQSGLGPNGTFGTMVDDIDRGLRTTQIKSQQAFNIQAAAASMVESSSTIQSNSVSSQNTLAMYIRQMEVVKQQLDQFADQFFDEYFTMGIYILQGVVGFVLVSSLLILIGALSTHCYEIFQCRYMVHCGWCIYGIMYFGVILLAYVTMGLGSVGYGACAYFNASLSDPNEFSLLGDAYSQNVFNRLDVCILGDGDALTQFDINDQMKVVMELFTNIITYYDYDNPSSSNYIDLDISTGKISGWITAIEDYRLGIYKDSRDEQRTNDNPNYALQQLNLYSNEGGGVPTCSRDRWVFDSENCTDPNQLTYTATSLQSNGVELSEDEVTCISFNERLTTSMPSSWTQSDFTKRYVQIREDCPDAYEKIVYFGYTLINFRDSRVNMFQSIKDDLTELHELNSDFNEVMGEFRGRVDQFYESVATLNNIVASELDGLLVTSDCRTIGDAAQVTYNILCVNFMSEIAKVALCVLIMMITIVGGMLTGSIFGVRYANIHTLKRIGADNHQQIPQGSLSDKMGNLGDKQIMFSERSHSSEDDEEEKPQKKKK